MSLFSRKISIAMGTYNGEKYLNEQIDSILNQSCMPNELIICDDCSTDNTIQIIKSYLAKYPQIISLYQNEKNLGSIRNFEKAISLTTGDIIFLSDQDDIWYTNKIETLISTLRKKSDNLLIFSDGDLIDEKGTLTGSTLWGKWSFSKEIREKWLTNKLAFNDLLRTHNKVTGATVAFKKKLKRHILPIHIPANYWHDQWIALHAAALNGLTFTEESLIKYRLHSSQQIGLPDSTRTIHSLSTFNEAVSIEEYYDLIKKKYPRLFAEKGRLINYLEKLWRPIKSDFK